MAPHLAHVEEIGGNVRQLTFQSCWITLWMNFVSQVAREKSLPTSTSGQKHDHWHHINVWLWGQQITKQLYLVPKVEIVQI